MILELKESLERAHTPQCNTFKNMFSKICLYYELIALHLALI